MDEKSTKNSKELICDELKKITNNFIKEKRDNNNPIEYKLDEMEVLTIFENYNQSYKIPKIQLYWKNSIQNEKNINFWKNFIKSFGEKCQTYDYLWSKYRTIFFESLFQIFQENENKTLHRLDIANLFLNHSKVNDINITNWNFLDKIHTNDWENKNDGDEKLKRLRLSINKFLKENAKYLKENPNNKFLGYIVVIYDIDIDDENSPKRRAYWIYTRNYFLIKKCCSLLAAQGGKKQLSNVNFLDRVLPSELKPNNIHNIQKNTKDSIKDLQPDKDINNDIEDDKL